MEDENEHNNFLISTALQQLSLPTEFLLQIHTNNVDRAQENGFTISDADGEIYYSDGDFEDDNDYSYEIKLKKGCYQFLFTDKMEDGISIHWWNRNSDPEKVGINGSVKILSTDGDKLHVFTPDFGQELQVKFIVE